MTIKLEGIEAKVPKLSNIKKERTKALTSAGKLLRKDYKSIGTTFSVENKPKVSTERGKTGDEQHLTVIARSPIIGFLNFGTGIHGPNKQEIVINPGSKGFLAFQSGYKRKTKPGLLRSGSGGAFGPFVYTTKPITSDGIEPNDYQGVIIASNKKPIQILLFNALLKGLETK